MIEPERTRDHSERMLRGFGAEVSVEEVDGERIISVNGEAGLQAAANAQRAREIRHQLPFRLLRRLIVPGSDIWIRHVGINETRTGLFEVLREMGAQIDYGNERDVGGEPVADIHVRHSALKAIEVPPDIAPRMIDEFPILFVAAAMAEGKTVCTGLGRIASQGIGSAGNHGKGSRSARCAG